MAGALIVTAELGPGDFARLDALRRRHFPPERNQLSAHLTLFHALPPSVETEAKALLSQLVAGPSPDAVMAGLMDLGGGVAFRIESEGLHELREVIADRFAGCLTAQDAAGWRPHVTIQNKVQRNVAKALLDELARMFTPAPLAIRGLELHRYLGGPWENLGRWRFRG